LRCSTINCRAVAYFLGAVIAVRLTILFLVGPAVWPDTAAYVAFADTILAHGRAVHPVYWTGGPAAPAFLLRLAGYPLVLAGAKLISPTHYSQIIVILQISFEIIAVFLMIAVLDRLSFTTTESLLAIGLYLCSDSLLFDNSILCDSIYASLFNIVIFSLVGHLVGCWSLTLRGATVLGFLWGFSAWVRDSGIYLTFLPIILLIAIACAAADEARHRFGYLLAFMIVVCCMTGAYAEFNKYRTGEFFFSITGVENWLRPVFDIAQYKYADPFAGADLVSETVRDGMPDYGYPAQQAFIERLHRRCKCTPTQLQTLVFRKYLVTLRDHPVAYLRLICRNFHYFGLVGLLADPIATINQFFALGTSVQHDVAPGLSIRNLRELRRRFSGVTLLLMSLNALSTAIATVLFSLFLFGIPYMVVRARIRREPIPLPLAIVAFLWFLFVSVSLVFSLVHYEAHHALPILPAGCIGIVYALFATLRRGGRRAEEQPR
jgi:hypothetical protein